MVALLDDILPPIGVWFLFSVCWFLCASFVTTLHETSITGIPKLLQSILSILLCVIASLFIGPIFLLILLLPCLISAITIFTTPKRYNQRFVRHYKILSSCGVLCLILLIAFSAYIQNTRSDIDFILKWPYTYAGKTKFIELYKKNPKGVLEIEEVLNRSDSETAARLCDSLSTYYDFEEEPDLKELCKPYMEP